MPKLVINNAILFFSSGVRYLCDITEMNDYIQRQKNSIYFKAQIMSVSELVFKANGLMV